MPELPEVETTRLGIEPYLKGKTVASIKIRNPNLRWPVSEEFRHLRDMPVIGLIRRGKYIVVEFPRGAALLHLGMSGSLRVVSETVAPLKHDHVDLITAQGPIIRFNDPRRFGCLLWAVQWQQHPLIAHLGPEPLGSDFTGAYLYELSRQRKTAIKQFVMNSQVVVGVGNIYANEALYLAGIDPRRQAGRISAHRMDALVDSIRQVLQAAIGMGGTTLRDFVGSDGKPGYFRQQLFVYGRGGEACKRCSEILKEVRQQGRTTVFCTQCQR